MSARAVSDAALVRRVRWRLLAWSGGSTLAVLVLLGSLIYVAVANSRITTVDTSAGDALTTVGTGDLATARWYGTATPLPNGQVFLSSGANVDEVDFPGSESPIRTDELFTVSL